MRQAAFFLAIAGAAALMAVWLVPREPRMVQSRPPAPSAEEEGTDLRAGSNAQGVIAPRRRAGTDVTTPARRQQLPGAAPPSEAGPADPTIAPSASGSAAGSNVLRPRTETLRSTDGGVGESGAGPSPPDDEPTEHATGTAADTPTWPAAMTPPVLLTPNAVSYPSGAYRVVLDRTSLTSQLSTVPAQGRVVVKVLIRVDGSVAQVAVVESSGVPRLDDAAVTEAFRWMFSPATRDGLPILAWAIISIRFVVP